MRLLGLKCKSSNVSRCNSYKGQVGKTVKNLLLNKVIDEENHKTYYERNFKVSKMNEVWCTDITEFKLGETKLYLSPIIDLYNDEIISYDLSECPTMYQIMNMMNTAFDKLNANDKLIFHSDQGWQYQQTSFQNSLKEHNITQSMSR